MRHGDPGRRGCEVDWVVDRRSWTLGPTPMGPSSRHSERSATWIPLPSPCKRFWGGSPRRAAIPRAGCMSLEGEPGTTVYILELGWVRATRTSSEGREQAMLFLQQGDIFGDVAVFSGTVYPVRCGPRGGEGLGGRRGCVSRRWRATGTCVGGDPPAGGCACATSSAWSRTCPCAAWRHGSRGPW